MKKWIVLLLALLMCFGAAQAEYPWLAGLSDTGPSVKDLVDPAQDAYPDWQVLDTEEYWTGLYNGGPQHEHHCLVYLYRVAEEHLLVMSLWTMANPLKEGDPIPWEESHYAPIPLTAEAAERIAAMAPEEVFEKYEGASLTEAALPGCADFLVQEGETLRQLIAYPDFLVGIAQDAREQESLRIGHWNGTAYEKVTATAMSEYVSINEIHSWNDGLEIYVPGAELGVYCDDSGVWRVNVVTDGGRYFLGEDYLVDAEGEGVYWTNAWYAFGVPTFPVELDGMDFAALPVSTEEAIPMLDPSGYACTKADGAPVYDAPGGNALGSAYARLTGRIIAEQDGWVQLQIGSEDAGLSLWFRMEDLAFGAQVNEVTCTFPSYEMPEDMAEDWYEMWLIAEVPGGWLAQVDVETVRFVSAEEIDRIGRPCNDWGELEDAWY